MSTTQSQLILKNDAALYKEAVSGVIRGLAKFKDLYKLKGLSKALRTASMPLAKSRALGAKIGAGAGGAIGGAGGAYEGYKADGVKGALKGGFSGAVGGAVSGGVAGGVVLSRLYAVLAGL